MMNHSRLRKILFLALMTTVAIVLHFIEGLFPIPIAFPGIKLGLSNVVSLVVLYLYGPVPAFIIIVLRVFLTSFLYSGFASVIFSLAGGILSVAAMTCIWKLSGRGFGIVGAGVMGGIFHNTGQIIAASVVLGTSTVFSYLPVLLISGTVTGIATGMLAGILVPRVKKYIQYNEVK